MPTIVQALQTEFHTTDDDKDRDDGVSETFKYANQIIGQNRSWGKDLVFRNNSVNTGEKFDVSRYQIPPEGLNRTVYEYIMDNDDGWHVIFIVKAWLTDGSVREVYRDANARKIANGSPRTGSVQLHS